MAEAFKWAFIGTGTLAKKVIKEISATGRHSVVSAYSRNRERLEAFCAPYGSYASTSVEDAVLGREVDGVYISVTNESHYEICRKVLELGKPVLLEKPFTVKASETEELQALARSKGLYLSEAMWTWYSDVPNKVLNLVKAGRLGKIKDVYLSYSRYSIDYAPRVSDPLLGGGALLDIGIYPITYCYRLFGFPKGIHCSGDIVKGADYSDDIVLDYDGFKVKMDVSIVGTKGEVMVIEGSNGILMNVDYHYGLPAAFKIGSDIEVIEGEKGYTKEFDAVASEIREGLSESRFIPMSSTLDCMRILDECRRQMNLVYPFEK